jgi:DNA invertase Pin-like site-specific DNA recombinase
MDQKFDLIIVKSISRLARNVVTLLSTVRKLAEKKIGVLFESEAVYSLNDMNHLSLTFQATVAEEESRIRSRSMEASLRMRLDHGLPLTPELLGFLKNEDGKLVANPDTQNIPKLMFFMYLYGYSTQQIADVLTKLSKRTYLGNLKWTAGGVARSLRKLRTTDLIRRKRQHPLKTACYKGFCGQGGAFRLMCGAGKRAGMRIGPCTMDTITL